MAKSKAQAIKNEEKLLLKKTYTYTYSGEIIFVKKNDNGRLPNTLSQVNHSQLHSFYISCYSVYLAQD